MKNKLLLVALLVNATAQANGYTSVENNHFAAPTVYSWNSSSDYAALKDADPSLVAAHIRSIDTKNFTLKAITGIVVAMYSSMIILGVTHCWEQHKVYCAKKAKEIAKIKEETKRITARR